jgi:hypothetical protein
VDFAKVSVGVGKEKPQIPCPFFDRQEDSVVAAPFRPNKTSFAIMQLVHGYFCSTRKPWTLMSQKWILEQLEAWYGLRIARSTLNYNLRLLREEGIIETVTRHKRDPISGEFVCQVTLYKATKALKKYFGGLARYFKRCKWVPDVKALWAGHQPVVGRCDTPDKAYAEAVSQKRARAQGRR